MFDLSDPTASGGLRLGVVLFILVAMALLEALLPRRQRSMSQSRRRVTNLSITAINTATIRLLFPVTAIGVGIWAGSAGYGLLNMLNWPGWVEGLLAFLLLDLAIYIQHVLSHKIPLLWRLHQMHHADPDIDATTGILFHPIEIALSMAYKMAIIVLFGALVMAIFLFEVVLNGGALFNHANLKLPLWFDWVLRWLVVTPDMHRVHHSVIHRETDSNYGFNLSIWDRLFGTYIDLPSKGHTGMTIGLVRYRDAGPTRIGWSLVLPFRSSGRPGAEPDRVNQ